MEPLTPDQRKQLAEQCRSHLEHLIKVTAAYSRMVDAADPLGREPTDAFLTLTAAAGKLAGMSLEQLADLLDCCGSVKEECRLLHATPEQLTHFRRMARMTF